MLDEPHYIVAIVTCGTVVLAVMIHYYASLALADIIPRLKIRHERRILLLIFGLLLAHVVEIWMFGLTAAWLSELEGAGGMRGYTVMTMLDYIYLSATTYTTLGYGELVPTGPLRFLFGTEALTGFLLITWSASLTFLEMTRNWK